jgi:hypothetical protein
MWKWRMELIFLRANIWFVYFVHEHLDLCTTKNGRKTDDSAEFQIVPTISNQILFLAQMALA